MSQYIPIIGLEIHVELKTNSKMFCACTNDPDRAKPNTNICPICLAHPGTLPVPNKTAIEWAIKIASALGCQINEHSKFDRKHYFYPDLPKGYQISQYDQPIGKNGQIILNLIGKQNPRVQAIIGITRVHLEEDTAKMTHKNPGETLVDFNRAGVPLVEIVSCPDFQTGTEAKLYCQELQTLFRYLNVSDANMEKGQMRCEANISLQTEGQFQIVNGIVIALNDHTLNHKVEIKNINSFRAVEKAIDFEINRQTGLLNAGQTWKQQTRGWNDERGETILQREKETAADYRYFPEPDIPPFTPGLIATTISLPELPPIKRHRFHEEFGLSYADADLLTADIHWADYTEQVYTELIEWLHSLPENQQTSTEIQENKAAALGKLAGNWMVSKLMGAMAERKIDIRLLKLRAENFAELIALIYSNRVNSTNAQKILGEMLDNNTDTDPTHIMEEKGYGQIGDEKHLGAVIDEVIKNYPRQVQEFKNGKEPLLQFLKGMVMKATEGSADPLIAEKILRTKLQK